MTFTSPSHDPFYVLLSQCLHDLRGALAVSLTDRRGDIIAQVTVGQAEGAPSEDELSIMHVYGQLAYQQTPTRLSEVNVERGIRRWQSRRLIVDDDVYDLWLVCSTAGLQAATLVEISTKLDQIEGKLFSLLKGA